MNCLFRACSVAVFAKSCYLIARTSFCGVSSTSCKKFFNNAGVRTVDLEFCLTRIRVQCFSSQKSKRKKSTSGKSDLKSAGKEEMNPFFVVRKGDIVGVYDTLSECQAQVGSSVCDPPVSVYKGFSLPKESKEYFLSCGLKNALYSIRAEDLRDDLFGQLVPCPFQHPSTYQVETTSKDLPLVLKRSQEWLGPEVGDRVGDMSIPFEPLRKDIKLDHRAEAQTLSSGRFCILKFDGASKGNPGQAGAGAVLLTEDGTLICRLREGLGIATNNVAEYRGMILGLRYALQKGYNNIRVIGDSKLVCMQVQGLWKVKNQNMSNLYDEASKLKEKFLSFQIIHVLRDSNTEADVQANLAVHLADGQIQEEIDN